MTVRVGKLCSVPWRMVGFTTPSRFGGTVSVANESLVVLLDVCENNGHDIRFCQQWILTVLTADGIVCQVSTSDVGWQSFWKEVKQQR